MNYQNNTNGQSVFDVDFRDVALLLLKRIWLIILAFVLCFGYTYYAKETTKVPLYTATAKMFVTNSNDTKYYYSSSDSYNALQLIETCSVVIKTNSVMEQIAQELDNKYSIPTIRGSISVSSENETEVMVISCVTADPQASADICNAVLEVVPTILKEKIKVGAAEILDTASVPTTCTNLPSYRQPTIYGMLAAGVVAVVIVLAYLLDTRIRSKEEITAQYGIPVLSDIPNFNIKTKERYQTYYEHR